MVKYDIRIGRGLWKWLDLIRKRDSRLWGVKKGYIASMPKAIYEVVMWYEKTRGNRSKNIKSKGNISNVFSGNGRGFRRKRYI